MSATLGALLRLVEPDWSITLIERLDGAAAESSDPWNNAGTGHSALCELNYTPQRSDGSIDITKAVQVNEQFQVTRQFWAYAVENGVLPDVRSFLNPIPHVSFVHGAAHVDYLKRRHDALVDNPLFASMEFIDDKDEFARRLPLMAAGRDFAEPVALNWAPDGTDVDFGSLSRQLIGYAAQRGTTTLFGHEVRNLQPAIRRQLDAERRQPAHRGEAQARTRSSCSSARAVARCRCCRRRASPRSRASAASRSAASSCAPTTRCWRPRTGPRCTAVLPLGAPPCRRRT